MVLGFGKKKKQENEEETRPFVAPANRFDRQIKLPEIGEAGQEKLKKSRVMAVGCGGLGTAAAMYLAAAGVGTIGLIDNDFIDLTNIQRQPIYRTGDVGKRKSIILGDRLKEINPEINVVPSTVRLRYDNAMNVLKNYDVVLDCSDNFPTRYLVSDACVLLGKPDVFASVLRFDGQAAVFDAKNGPCYRCVFRDPPKPGSVLTCEQGGILGPVAGLAGLIQATETIKLILGSGNTLAGRLLFFSASDMYFHEAKAKKDDNCSVCGKSPSIRQLIDYEEWCGVKARPESAAVVLEKAKEGKTESGEFAVPASEKISSDISALDLEISPKEVKEKIDAGETVMIVDVREPWERDVAKIEGTNHVPLGELPAAVSILPKDVFIITHCHHGVRSLMAAEMMAAAGFTNVKSMKGGIDEWSKQIDSSVPTYD